MGRPLLEYSGNWLNQCQQFFFGINPLGRTAHIVIDLKGDGLDTELKLHQSDSAGAQGAQIDYNDDNPEVSGTPDSRLGRHLGPGFYLVEGRLKTAALAHASKSLTLTIKREELVYHEGRHQVDHTAAYSVGPMPSWTPVPDVEDPRVIIPVGIAAAAGAWTRPAGGAWPHVAVCESTACTANSDGYVVSIQVTNVASTCPTSVACVYLSDRYIVVDPITEHRHIGNVPLS